MTRGILACLAACVCTGAIGYYAGSANPPTLRSHSSRLPETALVVQRESEPPHLQIAVADMRRLFDAHPDRAADESAINLKRSAYRNEWNRLQENQNHSEADRFRKEREKDLEQDADKRRQRIVDDLLQRVRNTAAKRHFDVVLDRSGKTLNGVPILMYESGLDDITDEVIGELLHKESSP